MESTVCAQRITQNLTAELRLMLNNRYMARTCHSRKFQNFAFCVPARRPTCNQLRSAPVDRAAKRTKVHGGGAMRINGVAIALATLGVVHSATAQDQPTKPATILECVGNTSAQGINAPKDEVIPSPSSGGTNTYTIDGNSLIVSGGGGIADARLVLCKSTSTTYVYSNDCAANRRAYITDWLTAKDYDSNTSPFFKKYGNSAYLLQIVIVDRVSLHLNDEALLGHVRTDYDEAANKVTLKPFLTSFSYDAGCKIVKPKI